MMNLFHYLHNERGQFGIDPNVLALRPQDVLLDEYRRRQEVFQAQQAQREYGLAQRRLAQQQRTAEMQRVAQAQQVESQQALAAERVRQQQADRASKEKMFKEAMEAERTGKMTKFQRDVYLRALSEGFIPEAESPSTVPGVEGMPTLVAPEPVSEEERARLAEEADLVPTGVTEEATYRYGRDYEKREKGIPTTTQYLTRLSQAIKEKEKVIGEIEEPVKPPLLKMTVRQKAQVRVALGLKPNVSEGTVHTTMKTHIDDFIKTGSNEEINRIREVLEVDLGLPASEVNRYLRYAISVAKKVRPLRKDIEIFRAERERIRGF